MIKILFFLLICLPTFAQTSMRITATADGVLQDEVLVQFGVNATNAKKFNNINENLAIVRGGKLWAVERRPELVSSDTTFIAFYGKRLDKYKLTFAPNAITPMVTLVLDGKEYGLSNHDTVSLDLPFPGDTSRMMLVYRTPGPKPLTYPNPVSNDSFTVYGLPAGRYMFRVYDQNGTALYARTQDVSNGRTSLKAGTKKGVYYINIYKAGMPQQIVSVVKQ